MPGVAPGVVLGVVPRTESGTAPHSLHLGSVVGRVRAGPGPLVHAAPLVEPGNAAATVQVQGGYRAPWAQ